VPDPSTRFVVPLAIAGGVVALALALTGSVVAAILAGLLIAGAGSALAANAREEDPGRRRFLALLGGLGLAGVVGGTALGRAAKQIATEDPDPALESMAGRPGTSSSSADSSTPSARATSSSCSRPTTPRTTRTSPRRS
jgi:Zn-dependent alcohol dehydrogenase